jgi:ATP-binding cassette, subfamily C, bacterial PrsD
MTKQTDSVGGELRQALNAYRGPFGSVIALTAALNILLLSGSLYMMLVYDSVLVSYSIPTLLALFAMVGVAYAFQALFDIIRARIMAGIASGFDRQLAARVHDAATGTPAIGTRNATDTLQPLRDLDQLRAFIASPALLALIDLPWMLIFLLFLFALHVWLGVVTLVGALALIALTLVIERRTSALTLQQTSMGMARGSIADANVRHGEMIAAMGMRPAARDRWMASHTGLRDVIGDLANVAATYGGIGRVARLFLQSAILTVGALLVIDGKASAGIIFASSIIAGRALAPIDAANAQWRSITIARQAWARLGRFLDANPEVAEPQVALRAPQQSLAVDGVAIAPPNSADPVIRNVSFAVSAGSATAIVGPSGCGKTMLARALTGILPPVRGTIRFDNAGLDQWHLDALGRAIGYLPQTVELIDGTIAENIARHSPDASSEAIIAAAEAAGAHTMIVAMPDGYETRVGSGGRALSAGQNQRIGLARALYGDPFLVVLDEPNAHLDGAGEDALAGAIRGIKARGGIAIVIAHRPAVVQCVDHVLVIKDGQMAAFGPRDEILATITRQSPPSQRPVPVRGAGS